MEYRYVAYTNDRKLSKGSISGASQEAVSKLLINQGLQPVSLKAQLALPPMEVLFPSLFKIKPKEVIMFSRQLATLLDAGISIVPGIQLMGDQMNNRAFRKVLAAIVNDLRSGMSFSDALLRHEKVFGELYCQLIAAGERIGGLGTLLRQAADYLERDLVIKKKIKKALTYPIIVMVVAFVVMAVMAVFVLPKMVEMFTSLDAKLPATTQFMISMNDFIGTYKLHLLVGIVAGVALLITYTKQPSGKRVLHRFLLTGPVIGQANLMSEMARFSRTLVLLVHAGLPLPEIIQLAKQTSNNVVVQEALGDVRTGLLQGEGLSQPMARNKTFPNLLVQMVMVGEESGKLESTLTTVASSYETEADDKIQGVISMIEPAMTLALAVMIGFIAISVITPMYSMSGAIAGK